MTGDNKHETGHVLPGYGSSFVYVRYKFFREMSCLLVKCVRD